MDKKTMLTAMAEVVVQKDISLFYDDRDKDVNTVLTELALCVDLTCDIEYINGETKEYIVKCIETYTAQGRNEKDEAKMHCLFEITAKNKKDVGYIKFDGIYSSWDSSLYHSCYVVKPVKVNKTVYMNALEELETN